LTLRALDRAGNGVSRSWDVALDTRPPGVSVTSALPVISPNGDGVDESSVVSWSSNEHASGRVRVIRGSTTHRTWTFTNLRAWRTTWSARDASGTQLADGVYTFHIETTDVAGNMSVTTRQVASDRTAGFLAWSTTLFHPQDGDAYAPSSRLSFKLIRTATVSLDILSSSGSLIRRAWANRSMGAGTWSWAWDGRNGSGAFVPAGTYRARLTVTSVVATTAILKTVVPDAFSVSISPTSPTAGETFKVSFRSAEPLAAAPRVTLKQNGATAVVKTATSLGSLRYEVSFPIVAGATGTATLTFSGRDVGGGTNTSRRSFTVR
jgi:hypothetical protein